MIETATCPSCGKTYEFDRYYVRWCEHCNWGVDPAEAQSHNPKEVKARARAKAKGERTYSRMSLRPLTRPGWTPARAASVAIAVLIHLASVAFPALGVILIVTNISNFLAYVFGIPLLALGYLLAPRRRKLASEGAVVLIPSTSPRLYGFINRIAQSIGGHEVDVIVIDGAFNASHELFGWRQRRVLRIGLPLWNILSVQERTALVGHEIAHEVNGDIAHGIVIASALRALGGWHRALTPVATRRRMRFDETFGADLMSLLAMLVELLYELEMSLVYASKQRAEYYADSVSARVASTGAAVSGLERLHLRTAIRLARDRFKPAAGHSLWDEQRYVVAQLPPKELERLRRVDERRGTAVDSTHPPTSLRMKMLLLHAPLAASIEMTSDESESIEAELRPAYELVARYLVSR